MTALQSPAETIEMRDALAEFLKESLLLDYRVTVTSDSETIPYDYADELIRSGWVTEAPEAQVKL